MHRCCEVVALSLRLVVAKQARQTRDRVADEANKRRLCNERVEAGYLTRQQ